jgi:hypothetical protein
MKIEDHEVDALIGEIEGQIAAYVLHAFTVVERDLQDVGIPPVIKDAVASALAERLSRQLREFLVALVVDRVTRRS